LSITGQELWKNNRGGCLCSLNGCCGTVLAVTGLMCVYRMRPGEATAADVKGGSRVGERGSRGRGAAGAERVGFGEGVSPSPTGRVLGRGCAPPQKFFEFLSQNGAFLCILQSAAVILGSENAWRRGSV